MPVNSYKNTSSAKESWAAGTCLFCGPSLPFLKEGFDAHLDTVPLNIVYT